MRRLLACAALVVLVLPAAARGDELPTELWSEYPLVQEVERTSTPSLGELLPPSSPDTAPAPEGAPTWAIWGAAMTAVVLALLLVAGHLPAAAGRLGRRGRSTPWRSSDPVPRPRVLAQYAPRPPRALPDEQGAPWRSIVTRTGLLRGRYVVLEGEPHDEQQTIARSKGFWSVGSRRIRSRLAEDAWDDLLNDLRASGWEPDPDWHSDFYVLLQPVEPEPTVSIVPTLDAYGRPEND
jgi:hypothetical protein